MKWSPLTILLPLFMILLIFALLTSHTLSQESLQIRWLGWPVTAEPYQGIDPGSYGGNPPPHVRIHTDRQLGMRSDGVCVWRALSEKKQEEQ